MDARNVLGKSSFVATDPRSTVGATTTTTTTPILGSKGNGKVQQPDKGAQACYYVALGTMPDYTPKGKYATVVELCDLAETYGKSRGWAVNLTGRDGGKKQPAKGFTCYTWGGRKFIERASLAMVKGLAENS